MTTVTTAARRITRYLNREPEAGSAYFDAEGRYLCAVESSLIPMKGTPANAVYRFRGRRGHIDGPLTYVVAQEMINAADERRERARD